MAFAGPSESAGCSVLFLPSLDGVTLGHRLKAILEHIETRDRELADQAGHFQVRIEELTRQLGELDAESENLRITRKTLLTLPLPSPATGPDRPEIPDHPAYQQILTALADAGRPMRAREAGRCAPATSARPSTCRSFRRTPKASAAH
ncbi:hypothetical protein [Streptomyces sp. Ag109_O5-10]|uniref:hypothetical protein n=1 Tax=Streptomyces sp. Ag109_O5-10 TaxID=1855349 RepID=UPI00210E7639|nr:hypothetical protein [Streptomyces sp. Ag109_O5-10]